MTWKCKRCGKTARTTAGLRCPRCDLEEARMNGTQVEFSSPPSFNDITQIESPVSSNSYSGGGGEFGGGGASGDF